MDSILNYVESLRLHPASLHWAIPCALLAVYGLMELGNYVQMHATYAWLLRRPDDSVTVAGKIVPTRGGRGWPEPRIHYTTREGRAVFRSVGYGVPFFNRAKLRIGQEVEVTYCASDYGLFYIEPYLAQTLAACVRKRLISPIVMVIAIVLMAFLLFLA